MSEYIVHTYTYIYIFVCVCIFVCVHVQKTQVLFFERGKYYKHSSQKSNPETPKVAVIYDTKNMDKKLSACICDIYLYHDKT